MRMTIICCPFKTSFGSYASSLKTAIESKTGETVQWVGSNCGCGDPIEKSRQFLMQGPSATILKCRFSRIRFRQKCGRDR